MIRRRLANAVRYVIVLIAFLIRLRIVIAPIPKLLNRRVL